VRASPVACRYLAKPGARPYCSAQPSGVLLDAFDGANFLLPPEVWRHFDWSIKHCVLRGDNSPIPLPKKSDL
jgi:peptide-methionine (S)-S-oxide reductase